MIKILGRILRRRGFIIGVVVAAGLIVASVLTSLEIPFGSFAAARLPSQITVPFQTWFIYLVAAFAFVIIFLILRKRGKHVFPEHVELPSASANAPKLIFIALDGAADRPCKALAGKTPLETASIPNINFIATRGQVSLLEIMKGVAPESDEAALALLGYDPYRYGVERGAIEAIGAGVDFDDGDLVLRGNFATVENGKQNGLGKLISGQAAGLTTKENKMLVDFLNKKLKLKNSNVELKSSVGYRLVVHLKPKAKGAAGAKAKLAQFSAAISNTHPGYTRKTTPWGVISAAVPYKHPIIQPSRPLDNSADAKRAAAAVNEFSSAAAALLEDHPLDKARAEAGHAPANFILLRDGATKKPRLFDINMKYKHKWAILADMAVEVGVGKAAGMKILKIPELSGNDAEDYRLRAAKAAEALKDFDCVYVHLKGPDNFSHKGDAVGKTRCLENIDKFFFGQLLKEKILNLNETVICITCDHTSSTDLRAHTPHPVPLLIYYPKIKMGGAPFNEKAARASISHLFRKGGARATGLMPLLMRHLRQTRF